MARAAGGWFVASTCLFFVSACLHAGLGADEPTLSPSTERIYALIAAGDGAGAAKAFAEQGEDRDEVAAELAYVTLDRALASASPAIRSRAVQIVEAHEVEPLADEVAALLGDPSDEVAAAASVALLTSHPAAGRVAQSLLKSPSAAARARVVAGIGRKVGKLARADLVAALADADSTVRRAAAVAVGGIGDARDRAALLKVARHDPEGRVRAAAWRALARLPAKEGAARTAAKAALADAYLGARLAAVDFLAARGDLAALTEAAGQADLHVALAAALAIDDLGGESAAPILTRALAAPAWSVRIAALVAIKSGLPHREALSLAARALVDDRVEVRLAAARALASLGQVDRARAEFLAALDHPRPGPRRSAAGSLLRLGDPRGAEILAALVASDDPDLRRAAIATFKRADNAPPALISALADPTADIRLAAADTLLAITTPDY